MKVLGISCMTNMAAGILDKPLTPVSYTHLDVYKRQFQQSVAQLVQLVDILTFVEMIVEPQHLSLIHIFCCTRESGLLASSGCSEAIF